MHSLEQIMNVTPGPRQSLRCTKGRSSRAKNHDPVTHVTGKEARRGAAARLFEKSGLRGTIRSTDTTEAETLDHSDSTLATNSSLERSSVQILKTFMTSNSSSSVSSSHASGSFLSSLRLDQEEVKEGLLHTKLTKLRQKDIENARRNLSSMRKWKTPYDIDPPHRIRLASERSLASTASTSTDMSSSTDSDPMVVERQIWNGIEALMADAFSVGGDTVRTEDVLPKSLIRAMSKKSFSGVESPLSELTPEEIGEIQMAQAALNSFVHMLVPEESKDEAKHDSYSTMPSLESVQHSSVETVRDSESLERRPDHISRTEVALRNFMDALLHDREDEVLSDSEISSRLQILDLFQWSLKVNIDAEEKIKYLENERLRLEEERQRELQELMESERRLEQERAQIEREEEKRRHRIQELEEHLAQEQQALAKAQTKAYHAMTRNRSPRESPIAEEEQVRASTHGGKPTVISSDERIIDPATPPLHRSDRISDLQDLQRSSGDISTESDLARRYLVVTSRGPSPMQAPKFDREGTLPREPVVRRMPSWTIINDKRIVMATGRSDASPLSIVSHGSSSSISNHLPSSFYEGRSLHSTLNESDGSSRKSLKRNDIDGIGGRALSQASMDMPDLASISEGSVQGTIETPPYISTGRDFVARQYPGGVPRAPSTHFDSLRREPSWQNFERVPSSRRLGIVSTAGDVYTDDVSQYSFSKFIVDQNMEGTGDKVISVKTAGDIQVVGSAARSSDSPSPWESGDSSVHEGVTPDSRTHLLRDNRRAPGINRSVSRGVRHAQGVHRGRGVHQGRGVQQVRGVQQSRGIHRDRSIHRERSPLGSCIKKKFSAICKRGKCLTTNWFCDNPKRYNDIPRSSTQLERFNSRQCLLETDDSTYDRTYISEKPRLKIDDNGFVVRR